MKVAANEVERTLQLAQAEVVAQGPNEHDIPRTTLQELQEAFRRAGVLGRTGLHWKRVRGRKSFKYREVLVMTLTRTGTNGRTYNACVVPYTETELAGRRVTTAPRRRHPTAHYPFYSHVQWVDRDRLEPI